MGTRMRKGFFKPIRYFSSMFESSKEPEMQIGLPTDIKHVAHIGCDGPNANAPTWMKDYHSAPINPTYANEKESASQGSDFSAGGIEESSATAGHGVGASATPTKPKHTRRHKSDECVISESAEETKKHRRARKKSDSAGGSQDMPTIPKQSRRRKSKDMSGGSAKPSKHKGKASDDGSKSGCTVADG